MKAECRSVMLEISAYLDGDLARATCERIERHCVTCASCGELVDSLKRTVGLCRL